MATNPYLTTTQVAVRLRVTPQAIRLRVKRGTITPSLRLDNGNYLFTATDVEATA